MRVLWLKLGGLWPLNTGGRQRSFNTIKELSRIHRMTVVTSHGPDDDPVGLSASLPDCQVLSLPFTAPKRGSRQFLAALARSWVSFDPVDLRKWQAPRVRQKVEELIGTGGYDVVVADFLTAVANLPSIVRAPVVLFEHNVEYQIWERLYNLERNWVRRQLLGLEWRKLRLREAAACRHAALTVAVSTGDRDELQRMAPEAQIVAVPTGVDTDYFSPRPAAETPGRLVFTGSMDWYPNEDAMGWLVTEILPRVRAEIPSASLSIVGRNPSAAVRALGQVPGVIVTGTVEDVRPFVEAAALYVVPLRAGGGTRLKIFEALAMGKAVLSTTVGAEGLDVVPGTHTAIADDATDFARSIVRLLADGGRRRALGAAGRQLVEARYSWKVIAGTFDGYLRLACDRYDRADGRKPGSVSAAEPDSSSPL